MSDEIPIPSGPAVVLPTAKTVQPIQAAPPTIRVPAKQAKMAEQKIIPLKREKPAGWFSYDDSGLRSAVLKNVETSDIPPGYKMAIAFDVNALPADHNYVSIDAHRHIQGGNTVSHISVSGKKIST